MGLEKQECKNRERERSKLTWEFNDKQATACLRRDRVLGLRGGSEREKSSGLVRNPAQYWSKPIF